MLPKDQLIEIVSADLDYLRKEWNQDIDDHSLRRSSTVLRRLLVDNELQRAWKTAGFEKEPQVRASTLSPILARLPKDKIIFASAGGAHYKRAQLRGALMVNYPMNQAEIASMHSEGLPEETFGLRAFIEAPCIVIKGRLILRRVLVKYISNKLGGAHFDTKRGRTEEEYLFSLLDGASRQIKLLDKNAVYFELLSAGQALIAADDIQVFLEKVRELNL